MAFPAIIPLLATGCMPNNPPAANAGADQIATGGAVVMLDGSASSDPDEDEIAFSWRQVSGPAVALSTTTAAVTVFTAPADGSSLGFQLIVDDGQDAGADDVVVTVHPAEQGATVREIRPFALVRDDPAVNGNFPDHWSAGEPPEPKALGEEKEEEGERPARVDAPLEDTLFPGETREISYDFTGPGRLVASVRWVGTLEPLDVAIQLNGATLINGNTYAFGLNRGGATADTEVASGGRATLLVTNNTDTAVTARMFFAVYALPQE
jgi:hypothetical protein